MKATSPTVVIVNSRYNYRHPLYNISAIVIVLRWVACGGSTSSSSWFVVVADAGGVG